MAYRYRLSMSQADRDRLTKCPKCCRVATCMECGYCPRHELPPDCTTTEATDPLLVPTEDS